jgi:SAM-dependent methyltransferase
MTQTLLKETKLLSSIRDRQKQIENFAFSSIIPKFFDSSIRNTRHFREWFKTPMNYCRIMELPLTLELLDLDLSKKQTILDISSPKLLAFYLAINGYDILATDLEDYFVHDFDVFAQKFNVPIKTECFDATAIPYQDNSFDRIFSVSVFEHIPDLGDVDAVKEVARVLRPGGVFVMTLPAYKNYLEEWLKGESFYWRGKEKSDGSVFFQRRYTELTIKERFENLGLEIEEIIWIAEKPIKEPSLNQHGRLDHNVYYLEELSSVKLIKKMTPKIPMIPYFLYSYFSSKTHYLTKSFNDENIRQVAIKLRKN